MHALLHQRRRNSRRGANNYVVNHELARECERKAPSIGSPTWRDERILRVFRGKEREERRKNWRAFSRGLEVTVRFIRRREFDKSEAPRVDRDVSRHAS